MRQREFGRTSLRVSEVGLGCSNLGGGLYGRSEQEALATLGSAFDRGITVFDTAPVYSYGASDALLGKAFKGKRDRIVLATKFGPVFSRAWGVARRLKRFVVPFKELLQPLRRTANLVRLNQKEFDFSPAVIRKDLEESLVRLGTDYVDLLQLDRPTAAVLRDPALYEELEALRKEGKFCFLGVCAKLPEVILLALDEPRISAIQIPVSLLDHSLIRNVLPLAAQRGVAVVASAALAQGLLTDSTVETMAEQSALLTKDEIRERKTRAADFRFLATDGRTMAQAATQFALSVPGVATVLTGVVDRIQLDENLGALSAPPLGAAEMQRIEALQRQA